MKYIFKPRRGTASQWANAKKPLQKDELGIQYSEDGTTAQVIIGGANGVLSVCGGAGVNVIVVDSLEALPADPTDGTIAIIPSPAGEESGNGGSGLPYVELTTIVYADAESGTELTAEESAVLDNAVATGLPIVIKLFVVESGGSESSALDVRALFTQMIAGENTFLFGTVGNSTILLTRAADVWNISIETNS